MNGINLKKHTQVALDGSIVEWKYEGLNPKDIVFTPEPIAKQIVEMFKPTGKILEPCKGEGAFLKYLPEGTEWCEIAEGRDFFDYNQKVDWIITNPPYSNFNRFMDHALKLADNVVFLTPLSKMLKSMDTMLKIKQYGGIKRMWILPARRCGFPFGFPCAAIHLQRGYKGPTDIEFAD